MSKEDRIVYLLITIMLVIIIGSLWYWEYWLPDALDTLADFFDNLSKFFGPYER